MTDMTPTPGPAPAVPPGWEDAREPLYRIATPDGRAIAWFCPEIGGNTVAYTVYAGGRWVQVFDVGDPAALRKTPSRYGLPLLFPFPGGMRGGTYHWAGREYVVPPTYPDGSDPDGPTVVIHGFAHIRPWRLVEHGGDRLVAEFLTPECLDAARAASYPFAVRLTHTVSLGPDGLTSVLVAENQGAEAAPLAMGLHPYFGADVLGPDRARVQVDLPGRSTRVRRGSPRPGMTGEREPAPAGLVSIVPVGERMGVSRTDLPPAPAVARVVNLPPIGGQAGWTIAVTTDAAYRDLLLFAPPAQSSISIEPYSHMPGNASLPEGHPEGLMGLAPGATFRAEATIRLVPPGSDA